ncbi:isoquinoline 1-oxidoreductase, beta subunit [Spirosomataceae bacterium TFI 002]|nr:isoquinoline 1-oxidoreductase, beta subunit [Spirosomataceae bacterium TFI 002]
MNSRRDFLKSLAIGGGGLVLSFNWASTAKAALNTDAATAIDLNFNAFLSIDTNGLVTIFSPNPEIGQGIKTAFPIVVAEELDINWERVKVEQANFDATKYDRQLTGGSGAIKHSWERLRVAGATAKDLLLQAASNKWGIEKGLLKAEDGHIIAPSGKKLNYGELVLDASKLEAPKDVKLKNVADFKLIGSSVKGVDNFNVLTGKPLFGIDYKREGMLNAQIQRPPAFGLKIKAVDDSAVRNMPGIVNVVQFDNKVAIVGKTTWEIMQARKNLKVTYEQDTALESSSDHDRIFTELMASQDESYTKRKDGDIVAGFAKAAKTIERTYECPFIPHSPMEPMNFFAHVKSDSVELAGPTQTPDRARRSIAKLMDIPAENISLELTKMGGGFGRRLDDGYAVEAAHVSKLAGNIPVKVTWTKEDDITGGYYRPAVRYKFKAGIDKNGKMIAYHLKGVGMNAGNCTRQDNFPAGAVENLLVESVDHKSPITTGPWRAPITNFLAYAEQSFLDEVAELAGKDTVAMRLELFESAKTNPVGNITYDIDRFTETIKVAAEKARWNDKKRKTSLGFSSYYSHNSYVTQIAEMEKVNGKPELKKVYAVTDCGIVINQSGSQNQIYGAIVDGIGHAMFGKLSFTKGEPDQKNFDTYRLIRYNEVPEVEAYFIDNGMSPTGLGEPALPPVGGAVANAIAKATGKRLYSQPFGLADEKVAEYL